MRLLIDTHVLIWAMDDPALVEGIPVVCADPAFDAYGISRCW